VRRWREDLAYLRKEMPARHANLFHEVSRAQFDSALSSIEARLPTLARHQVIVELQKLAALIGDGHSNVGSIQLRLVLRQTRWSTTSCTSAPLFQRASDFHNPL